MKQKEKTDNMIELAKEVPTSIISVQRQYQFDFEILDPKTLDETYAVVPEVSRSIDIRGAASIYRGYEIAPYDESTEAKEFANLVSYILNKSGGVNFIEQWQKNTDLYGDGYVELVDDNGKIVELNHVHSYNFGYELEEYYDETAGAPRTKIKLDKETQKPTGFASYSYDENKEIYVNNKTFELNKISHLKYKVIGDALYGISLIQPAKESIINKLKMENSIVDVGRLVSSPKIVLTGNFDTEEEARDRAKEAASLDVNDVVLLQNGEGFDFVNPGKTNLPELREIFVVNLTTATGIPRPILTSEGNDINKATMSELMRHLREMMRSNMNRMANIIEQEIFYRIGESYSINNFHRIIPKFIFPEDVDTEEEIIVREERKAATITSLSNSISILNSMLVDKEGNPSNLSKEIEDSMKQTLETYNETIKTFTVNNDQDGIVEEELPEDNELKLDYFNDGQNNVLNEQNDYVEEDDLINNEDLDTYNSYTQITLNDNIDQLKNPNYILSRHELIHVLYDSISNGDEIFDINSGILITLQSLVKKHKLYMEMMNDLGLVHEVNIIGYELDEMM